MDVLVAYATKHGSTKQVAEAIAAEAGERGARVELRPARDVRVPISGPTLVVLGAPLYTGRWFRDAHRFLRRHRRELAGMPVAVFAMGPRTDTEEAWHRAFAQLNRALGRHSWLHPVAATVFGGVDPPGHDHPKRDLRDWAAIRHWTDQLVTALARESR